MVGPVISSVDPRILVGVLGLSAAVTAGMAGYAYRHRDNPGAVWLAGTLAATTVWTGTYAIGLVTHDSAWRPFWEHLQWFGTAALPVCFLLFALEYTGHDRVVNRRTTAGLFVVPAITVLFVWTNDLHALMWLENRVVVEGGLATMVATQGPWFWVALAYSYALVLIGGALLIRLLFVSEYLYAEQSLLFSLGIVVPLIGNAIAVFVPTAPPGFDLTPYGFAVWGITLFAIVYRGRLFALLPATRRLGQNAAIAQLDDGIVIVDAERTVVYLNEAAASIFDSERTTIIGESVESLIGTDALDFGAEDAMAEFERDDRRYEVRASPIEDRRGRSIGHALAVNDVTARHRRERRLEAQREELERVNQLNAAIRGINRAIVSATDREEIHETACERLAAGGLYDTACLADAPTVAGTADRWTVAGTTASPPEAVCCRSALEVSEAGSTSVLEEENDESWTVVPITYRQTAYGVLCVRSDEGPPSDREREVLCELGELLGHAIDAVERRQLTNADAVVEVTLESGDDGAALAAVSERADCRLRLEGLIPAVDGGAVAFLQVEDGRIDSARSELEERLDGPVRAIRDDRDHCVLSCTVTDSSLLGALASGGANVTRTIADGGTAVYGAEVASDRAARRLLDRLGVAFPETRLEAKRQKDGPIEPMEVPEADPVAELTERQREVLEVALRAGYFDWPRGSTAEEVAESLGISSATLHGHLRKAERTLFDRLFER